MDPRLKAVATNPLLLLGFAAFIVLGIVAALLLTRAPGDDAYGPATAAFEPISFREIDGWRRDDHVEALAALLVSCARPRAEAAWEDACAAAKAVPPGDRKAARAFFETAFRPYRVIAKQPRIDGARGKPRRAREGLFTGYFEPVYEASAAPTAALSAPLYPRPADLVTVDLGRFRPALKGERIAGYVENGVLNPYPDHAAINAGALDGKAAPLGYLDPDDLLFLQIQGSGRLRFPDGAEVRVGYDGQNGHVYFPVGRRLIETGAVAREAMSMQAIRAWLDAASPEDARALRETNPSYVFFRRLDDLPDPALGPLGAEGVQLTAMRSLAVDPRFHRYGTPVWLDLDRSEEAPRLRRLVIAQDTGGAIRGPVRGDLYIGSGAEAGAVAGAMQAEGTMIVLLPAGLAAPPP